MRKRSETLVTNQRFTAHVLACVNIIGLNLLVVKYIDIFVF